LEDGATEVSGSEKDRVWVVGGVTEGLVRW